MPALVQEKEEGEITPEKKPKEEEAPKELTPAQVC